MLEKFGVSGWTATFAVAFVALWKLWAFLAKFITAVVLIKLDATPLNSLVRPKFPRNTKEFWADKERLGKLMRDSGALKEDEYVASMELLNQIESEPDKNAISSSCRLTVKKVDSDLERKLDIFAKFQTGKGMPIWLQAVRAAVETGVCREADFYVKLRPTIPFRTPKPLYVGKSPWTNNVCIILEHLKINFTVEDGGEAVTGLTNGDEFLRVVPDHLFSSVEDIKLMVGKAAALHAIYLGEANSNPATCWIPAKKGLDFCRWAYDLCPQAGKTKAFTQIFTAIDKYFSTKVMTVIHGDFRPGNMIFVGPSPSSDVIVSDWEAVNVGSPAWDMTYASILGLDPQSRTKSLGEITQVYHQALQSECEARGIYGAPPLSELEDHISLLSLVLYCVSYTVSMGGFWNNQGNTKSDILSWANRVGGAVENLDRIKICTLLNIETKVFDEFLQHSKSWVVEMGKIVSK